MIRLTFPDGSVKEFESGVSAAEVAESIGPRLARSAVAAKIDGRLVDLAEHVTADAAIEIVTDSTEEGLEVLRHTASHVMAQAVKRLF